MSNSPRFLAVLALAGLTVLPAAAQDATTVIARVGTVELTLGHAIALHGQLPAQLQQAPVERLFPVLVEQMIDQEILAQSQAGRLTRTEQLRLDNEVRGFLSGAALARAIEASVTDDSVAQAYAAFAEAFGAREPATEWNAAHILVRTEDEIRAAAAAIAGGRDFAEVAREVSTDGSARQGGDLGWFGPGMMIPEFEAVVSGLQPGQVSDPLQTRFGWHLVRLAETRLVSVPPLEAVREQLLDELRRAAMTAHIAGLRSGTTVANLSEGLDPALLRRTDLLGE